MGTPRAFFDSKAGKLLHQTRQVLGWPATEAATPAATPAKPSSEPTERSSASSPAATSATTPAGIPAGTSANTPEEGSDEFPPLVIVTRGRAARVKRDDQEEYTPADFARIFLQWIATEYPPCSGRNVNVPDIEEGFLPRFKAAIDCPYLQLGTLLRGLGEVTEKGEERYTDWTGRRRSTTTYDVPRPPAAVVNLSVERKRA